MIKHLLAVTALATSALFSFVVSAAPYSVDDFAYSATISDAKTSLRQIQIPKQLYQKLSRSDYGDLRVFSAEGQLAPHQFSQPSSRLDSEKKVPLVFYPFNKEQAKKPGNIRVIINQKAGEQSFSINQNLATGSNSDNDSKNNEYQYILVNKNSVNKNSVNKTNNNQASTLCKLQLDWQQSKPSSIFNFRLEASDQLQNWRTLSRKLTISKLEYAGSQLKQDTVNFSCTTQKYIRLTWLQPEQKTHLSQIKGIYTKKGAQKIQWESFGKPRYEAKDGSWLFESNVVAAISRLEFIAPQDGLFYQGTLYSRGNDKQTWRYRAAVSQYRLNLGETTLQSRPLSFSPTSDKYWKLVLKREGQLGESQLPEIRAGWVPKQLYFLAQGKSPFTLAFGNPNVKPAQVGNLRDLIDSIKQSGASIDSVSLGEFVKNNKVFKAESETPWKLILFWLVLVLGTALMGFMAYRLFQQMSEDK